MRSTSGKKLSITLVEKSALPTLYTDDHEAECLREIHDLVHDRHSHLLRFGLDEFKQGGCLILGKCYAKSPYIYLGINPGWPVEWKGALKHVESMEVGPCSKEPFNSPFVNDQDDHAAARAKFWCNCHRFFARHPQLREWINNGVTSAFLSPWRTRNAKELWSLNLRTDGLLYKYSAEILQLMFEHHQAKVLIVAGKHTPTQTLIPILHSVKSHEDVEQSAHVAYEGPGKTYTWSDQRIRIEGRDVQVLQIPHFSRACSQPLLDGCAAWLTEKLRLHQLDPSDSARAA